MTNKKKSSVTRISELSIYSNLFLVLLKEKLLRILRDSQIKKPGKCNQIQ